MSNRFALLQIVAFNLIISGGLVGAQGIAPSSDPLVIQLEERALRGNEYLAESIGSLARIGEWKRVEKWLTRVAAINDDAILANMAGRIGPPILLRIARKADLSEQARATAEKLGRAARKQAESKGPLVAAIGQLGGSVDQRLAGMRRLLVGGDAAVAQLVEAAVAAQPPAPQDEILRTMLSLGDGGEEAIAQLSLYGEPQTRSRALAALVRVNAKANVPALLSALHATDATPAEVAAAKAGLQRVFRTLPSRGEALSLLVSDLRRTRSVASQAANDLQSTTLWSVNATRNGVTYQSTRAILSAYRDAADASARLRRLGDLPRNVLDMSLAADLSYRVMIDPDWGDQAQIDQIRAAYGPAASGSGLSNSIAAALENRDYPAAVGLLRMITKNPSVMDLSLLLSSDSPKMTPLVRATLNSDPRVRYEAASAIARLAPSSPYAGSSHVRRAYGEMYALGDRPLAALVETRPDVIVKQEQLLTNLGYDVRVVSSVAALDRLVAKGGELSMIVSKTQLPDFPPVELIDRVRRDPRGERVPIIFYGKQAAGVESDRWDALTRYVERPKMPDEFRGVIFDLRRVARRKNRDRELKPIALVLETRSIISAHHEALLADLGYEARVVTTKEEFTKIMNSGDDIGLIASPLRAGVFPPVQMVKVIRQHPKSGLIQIVLYSDIIEGFEMEGSDPFSGQARPVTAAAYADILVEIEKARRLPAMTTLDRRLYRSVAAEVLGKSPAGG